MPQRHYPLQLINYSSLTGENNKRGSKATGVIEQKVVPDICIRISTGANCWYFKKISVFVEPQGTTAAF
jgi:hypothetical protein